MYALNLVTHATCIVYDMTLYIACKTSNDKILAARTNSLLYMSPCIRKKSRLN